MESTIKQLERDASFKRLPKKVRDYIEHLENSNGQAVKEKLNEIADLLKPVFKELVEYKGIDLSPRAHMLLRETEKIRKLLKTAGIELG